jgi:hypothetical protein
MSKPRDQIQQRRGVIPQELELRIKEHRNIKRGIREALKDSDNDLEKAKIIPIIAAETGYPTYIINWHLTSMKKYGTAAETNLREGQYYKWALISKKPKKQKKHGEEEQ